VQTRSFLSGPFGRFAPRTASQACSKPRRSFRIGVLRPMIAASLALASTASADVLISNLSVGLGTGTAFGVGSTAIYRAAGFTMPAQNYTLDRVLLTLNFAASGTAVVSIWDGALSPQNRLMTLVSPVQSGQADFAFTPPVPLVLAAGQTYWVYVEPVAQPTGTFSWIATAPSTAPAGIATFTQYIFNGNPSTFRNRLEVQATPGGVTPCYVNCDGSTTSPILNVNDFICFQNLYAAGIPTANCDGSTTPPILNVSDFICFQQKYAAGCT
jgi:hypothetical protein